jgi:hypothetical protein
MHKNTSNKERGTLRSAVMGSTINQSHKIIQKKNAILQGLVKMLAGSGRKDARLSHG